MPYTDRFRLVEDYLAHLDPLMGGIADPFIQSRYLGFITTAAVTAYELAIKDIFIEFSDKKHTVLGSVARARFDRLNGRISLKDLREDHVKMFGTKYVERFNKKVDSEELSSLHSGAGSPKSSYGNIITWRNKFVHDGSAPNTTNYAEIKKSYGLGKKVILCLDAAMRR